MKYDALQNADVFMVGCQLDMQRWRLTALLSWVKPEKVSQLAGQLVELIEPFRGNNTRLVAKLPSDLEEMYTYLNMEVSEYGTALED